MKCTLIAIALIALTWRTEGNPFAKQESSNRRARQASFKPLFGGSSHFGYPYAGGRLNYQGNGWDASAQGKLDLGGNWEAGAGLGVGSNGLRFGVDGTYRSDNSWGLGSKLSYDKDNVGAFLSGTVNSHGGYGIGAGCHDLNKDWVITTFEFQTIFGSDEDIRNLFKALDITGDGIVQRDEFEAMGIRVIEECEPVPE